MAEKNLESIFEKSIDGLKSMVDSDTVIGKPINTPDGTTVIPYSRVSFGYGVGGFENTFVSGGSGGGVTMQPVGFLVISKDGEAKVISIDGNNPIEKFLSSIPDVAKTIAEAIK